MLSYPWCALPSPIKFHTTTAWSLKPIYYLHTWRSRYEPHVNPEHQMVNEPPSRNLVFLFHITLTPVSNHPRSIHIVFTIVPTTLSIAIVAFGRIEITQSFQGMLFCLRLHAMLVQRPIRQLVNISEQALYHMNPPQRLLARMLATMAQA